ncbi:MAG: acetyl-CoA carboxylase biotin carboxyl carrier protein subunit, partial [Thermoplasmata archaeon]
MKMENEILSNLEGTVSDIRVKEGDNVDSNDVMIVIS